MKQPYTIHLTAGGSAACGELTFAAGQLWLVKGDRAFLAYLWDGASGHRHTDLSVPLAMLDQVQAGGHPLVVCAGCMEVVGG